jgi:nucleoside-diphosphate-sugar epimerase
MNKLIIGETSQLAHFLPEEYTRVSSRDIPPSVYNHRWEVVYLLFAEQRTIFSENKEYKSLFYDINVNLTLKLVNKLKYNKLIFLSTTELWNLCNGKISIETPFYYKENYYNDSKRITTEKLKNYDKVITLYPFNFNSSFRNNNFLFGKIFHSIINKEKICVGNLNINRELLHANRVAELVNSATTSDIIGSGYLVNIKNFILDLYKFFNIDYNVFLEDKSLDTLNNNQFFFHKQTDYSYANLLKDYIDDIQNTTDKRHH